MAMLLAYVIGIIIFVDGLLSIMFTGVVTRPITDKFKVSREKLAYICDSTSAPINAIIPLNSWGAMLMGLIGAQIATGVITGDPLQLLIGSLPFQFYCIVTLITVLFFILTGKDWGPMKKAEERVRTTGKLYDDGVTPLLSDDIDDESIIEKGAENKNNMIVPLFVLITGAYLASLVSGKISGAFCPAIIFVLGSIMSFSTGTSWGTFSIMMPIAIPMAVSMNSNIMLVIGAVISGGIFGDHCSPMSDTTILSAMSSGTDLYSHFKTQFPYTLLSGGIAVVCYVVMGLIL